jgi:hypothetical protein
MLGLSLLESRISEIKVILLMQIFHLIYLSLQMKLLNS